MWFLLDEHYSDLNSYTLLYCLDSGQLPSQFIELLGALGIRDRCVRINGLSRVDTLFVPEDSVVSASFPINDPIHYYDADQSTHHYASLVDHIITRLGINANNNTTNSGNKVFFTPGESLIRQGVDSIERAFQKAGFIIYRGWEHSLAEQINMLQSCSCFASIEGSVSFMSLFCRKSSDIFLVRKLPYIVPYQIMINSLVSKKIAYIDANLSIFVDANAPYCGPFFLYCNSHLSNYMNKAFGVKLTHRIRWISFIRYVYYSLFVQRERCFSFVVEWRVPRIFFHELKQDLINNKVARFVLNRILLGN